MTGFAIIREPFYALQQSHYMVIKAQSPAGFAEEIHHQSIWNNRFPPGSILPAERGTVRADRRDSHYLA